MKKFLSIVAVAALMFTFASCQKESVTPTIKLDKELTMYVGQELQLVPTFEACSPAEGEIEWSSKDEEIATVDQKGNITALKKGDTRIVVTITKLKISATCNLEVKNDEPYLYVEKTSLDYGDTATYNVQMRSGKPYVTDSEITYELYNGTELVKDSLYRAGKAFLGYAPGEYKIVATAGTEKFEQAVTVNNITLQDLTPSTKSADYLVGTWKFTHETLRTISYINGVLKADTTTIYDETNTTIYGFKLSVNSNDSVYEQMKNDSTFDSQKYAWSVKNGYFVPTTFSDRGGATIALAYIASSFASYNPTAICGFVVDKVNYIPEGYAYTFNTSYDAVTLKSRYEFIGYKHIDAKNGVPAHYEYTLTAAEDVIDFALQKVAE